MNVFRLLTFLGFILILNSTFSQDLLSSRHTSEYTYFFQLTEAETRQVYKKSLWVVDSSFFHTVVDSFPTDSVYEGTLPYGTYLRTWIKDAEFRYILYPVHRLQPTLLNNSRDLAMVVRDPNGKEVGEAEVSLKGKNVPFDPETRSYRLPKTKREGLVEVTIDGHTDFHLIEETSEGPSFVKRVAYSVPLRYIWGTPYEFVRSIYTAIFKGYKTGWISRISSIFASRYNKRSKAYKYRGFLVTQKPIYRPGDTVKVKAFVFTRKGKPVEKDLEVRLASSTYGYRRNSDDEKKLGKAVAQRPGSYSHEIVLHDSLELKLDKKYDIRLVNKKGTILARDLITLEDYELERNFFTFRSDKEDYRKGEPILLFAQTKDDNDLTLPDARIDIYLFSKGVSSYLEDAVFVEDTLWQYSGKLEPIGETRITIPDSVFPAVTLRYKIEANMLTSDNALKSETLEGKYEGRPGRLKLEAAGDSLVMTHWVGNESLPAMVSFSGYDQNYDNVLFEENVQLPAKRKLNPFVKTYNIWKDDLVVSFSPESGVNVFADRSTDSVFVFAENPHNISLVYSIFRKNKLLLQGNTTHLDLKLPANNTSPYFLSIEYIWGDEAHKENYTIPLDKKRLEVTVNQPERIFPGQKVTLDIQVADIHGNPEPGIDLTAYSITKKFKDYNLPEVPRFSKRVKGRKLHNKYKGSNLYTTHRNNPLKYKVWQTRASLDTIPWFGFLYPENGISRYYMPTPDSTAQIAPFVVDEGEILIPLVVYIDEIPVYFGGVSVPGPYSFRVSVAEEGIATGAHRVTIRTQNAKIQLDSVYLKAGQKLVLSIDRNNLPKNAKVEPMPYLPTDQEKRNLDGYFLKIHNPHRLSFDDYGYIKQGERRVSKAKNMHSYTTYGNGFYPDWVLGPFHPDSFTYVSPGKFQITTRKEEGFSYWFSPGQVKMYEFNPSLSFWRELFHGDNILIPSIEDFALTEKEVLKEYESSKTQEVYKIGLYKNPDETPPGFGRLEIDNKKIGPGLENWLVFKQDEPEFLRLYDPETFIFHQLQTGTYDLLGFYPDTTFIQIKGLEVRTNGLNFYRIDSLAPHPTTDIMQQIYRHSTVKAQAYGEIEKNKTGIRDAYLNAYHVSGIGKNYRLISGTVLEEDGTGLAGVIIVLKGTTIGKYTDDNGRFEMRVPSNGVLVFSFIGYETQEIFVGSKQELKVVMEEAELNMDEVVVVGYGVSGGLKSLAMGEREVTQVASRNLSSLSNSVSGKLAGVQIRGARSLSTTVYIDGVPIRYPLNEKKLPLNNPEFSDDPIALSEDRLQPLSTLRSNFRDYAFWQPDLVTDSEGKASFTTTFPDDVTSWRTFVIAAGRKRTGAAEGRIRSYKDLMAQLELPRFLVEGDSTFAIGKVLNYAPDTSEVEIRFETNGVESFAHRAQVINSVIDTLPLVASGSDSLSVIFSMEKKDGYLDGEKREVKIFPKGITETIGQFHSLDSDTSLCMKFDPDLGPVKFYVKSQMMEIALDEMDHIRRYKYLCNEQASSKLKMLVMEKRIRTALGEPFEYDKDVKKLIRRLENSRRNEGGWGWWPEGDQVYWITYYVLGALLDAQDAGYQVGLNRTMLRDELIHHSFTKNDLMSIHIEKFFLLQRLDPELKFPDSIKKLEKDSSLTFFGRLRLLRLRQLSGLPYGLELLDQYANSTTRGNLYWAEKENRLLQNTTQSTLLAYKILELQNPDNPDLKRVKEYLMEIRGNGHWRNTYESTTILETLLPAILKEKEEAEGKLKINGEIVSAFPFTKTFDPSEELCVTKTGKFQAYLTAYQEFHNPDPKPVDKEFLVTSWFADSAATLKAGKPTRLHVRVDVKMEAEYVMVEVPIPAGCSYGLKKQAGWRSYEVHREYFRERTSIFCEKLPVGTYEFTIELVPRFSGVYTLNPARAEEMYFPVFYGRNMTRKVRIGG